MYKQDYSKYLNNNGKGKRTKKDILKKIWAWIKISLFIFVMISILWGCVQMYTKGYTINQVSDMAGNKVYAPGVAFEFIIKSLNDFGSKTHWFSTDKDGVFYEYQLKVITNWAEAFTVTASPFYGFFVYPLAYLLTAFIRAFSGTTDGFLDPTKSNYGVSVIFAILLTSIIVRLIVLSFTLKTQMNQEKMTSLQGKQAEIQQKYKGSNDPQAKQKQQMELMALYKKEGISPISSIATSFLSMPFLFAMFTVVRATHALKTATVGEVTLTEQPWTQIKEGNWIYLALIAVYLPMQVLSMFMPMILNAFKKKKHLESEQQRKAKKKTLIFQLIFIGVFIFIVSTVASGVAIYWIFSSTLQIAQTILFHYLKESKSKRALKKREKIRAAKVKKIEKNNEKNVKAK
ncbi:inner membrane protein translocase component YidC [Spiroplasma gladiatoris]|uniref:Inner membrane protein translocase component YidC n=1 Tax=Spiroplasma gladiatoris TaxID=2143 RepID=A0A4P7AKC7_9MOLU|nr:membrane protein insertase YidC [Spiroplasma gladiatoris]QBQ08223.1 inner membrane protein translocase component YidC [Spiroplasma gladiatoris]